MELADLETLIKTRRSVRKWKDQAVPEELLAKAVELATWAPNGGNQQNWRFYIILNKSKIKAIADAVQAKADLMQTWPEGAKLGGPGSGSRVQFFATAPAAIAVAAAPYRSPVDAVLEIRAKTDPMAAQIKSHRESVDSKVQSVSSAIAQMLLVLHQMGLGAVWMTGPMQAKPEIEAILKVPAGLDLIAFIPVGYPDQTPVSRGRKVMAEIAEIVR